MFPPKKAWLLRLDQFGLRVATRAQLGSRLEVLRAKVQISVILVT
jgi:hypothetical protein